MNIDALFKDLAEYKNMQKAISDEVDKLTEQIKQFMVDNNKSEIIGTEHRATYKKVNQTRIDSKKLKAELPDVAEKYSVDSSYMRLNFT